MRAKTKKWFSPLFVLTLAVAGIFGVSAAVVNKQAEKSPMIERADAASYTVYLVSGDSYWTSGNHRLCLGDGSNWSDVSGFSLDSDFATGDSANFNKSSFNNGDTLYNFEKITMNLNSGNWLTLQRYKYEDSTWKWASDIYKNYGPVNSSGYFDGANKIINKQSNVIYVGQGGGAPKLENSCWTTISGYYYKVKIYGVPTGGSATLLTTGLFTNGTTPNKPNIAGYSQGGFYTNPACTSSWDGSLSSDTSLYIPYTKIDMYFRVSDNSYTPIDSRKLTETVTFNSGEAQYTGTIALTVGDQFKISEPSNSWDPSYGGNNTDTAGYKFSTYPSVVGSYPNDCFTVQDNNTKCLVSGSYYFDITVHDGGTFTINEITRTPSGTITIQYHSLRYGIDTLIGSGITRWSGLSYNTDDGKIQGNVFGYDTDYWYTEPVANNDYKYSNGTVISANLDLYQIYTKQEYKTYFFETETAATTNSDWRGGGSAPTNLFRIWAQDSNGVKQHSGAGEEWIKDNVYYPIYCVEGEACVYSAYLPVGSTVILHVTTGSEYNGSQTNNIDLDDATESTMCWRITSKPGSDWHWSGEWTAFEAGYSLVTSSGETIVSMTSYDASSNLAAVYDVPLSSGDNINVKIDVSIGASISFDTLLYTLGDEEKTAACAQVTGSNKYFTMKTTSRFNFYLNAEHLIYIENETSMADSGVLYMNNGKNWENVYVYAYYESSGEHPTLGGWPGTRIDYMENVSSTVNLDYRETGSIYKILIAKLSSGSLTKATKVIFNDGTKGTKATAVAGTNRTGAYTFNPNATGSPLYYSDCTGSSDISLPSATTASAPIVAYDIEVAIRTAPNESVCNIEKETAKSLYDRYSAVSSTIGTSTITTWASKYSGSRDWTINEISVQLYAIGYSGTRSASLGNFNLFGTSSNGEDNGAIILIIIASSISILSITALSVLMVKKKKSANK